MSVLRFAAVAAFALIAQVTYGTTYGTTYGSPAAVVREFYARYAAGDLHGAAALWVSPGTNTTDATFVPRHRARLEKRCMQLQSLTVDVVSEDPPVFDVTSTMILRTAPESPEWWESSRSRITLQHDGGGWRIVSWEPREPELVERLVAAGAAAERTSILASSPELHTTTFARLASRRALELINQGRFDDAGALAATATAIAEHLGDPVSMAAGLSVSSSVRRVRFDHDSSLPLAEESAMLAEGGGDPDVLAGTLVRLARARERARGVADIELLQRALGLAGELEEVATAAHAAIHLGRAYEGHGLYREGFRMAQLGSRYAEQSGDRAARLSALLFLRGAYMWIGEHRVAHRYGLRAIELAAEGGYDAPAMTALIGVASDIARLEENYPAALKMLSDALPRARSNPAKAILFMARATLHRESYRFGEAERDLDQAALFAPSEPSSIQQLALARAHLAESRGEEDAVLHHLTAARGSNVNFDRIARHVHADVLARRGRFEEALAIAEELARQGDTTPVADPQRSLFQTAWYPADRLLVELLVSTGDDRSALRIAEELKARELRQVLAHRPAEPPSRTGRHPREQEIEERIRELNRRLTGGRLQPAEMAATREQLAGARTDLLDVRQRLYAEGPAASAARAVELCPDQLPPHLDEVTILHYVIIDRRTLVFVLEPKRHGGRRLTVRPIEIESRELADRTAQLSALIEQRNLRASDAIAAMYELLIAPVESFVRDARSLCIIPDASLWRVPFQALGAAGAPPLVERVPLFYAPSLSVLAAARPDVTDARDKPRLLAFANPAVDLETVSLYRAFDPNAPLGAIPETESEVRAIGRIYGRDASRIYVGAKAQEATLKREAAQYDVLHIATHGVVYDTAPMFSSLLLTASPDDDSEDGVLEAREIATLSFTAGLTVLSACETGRANVNGGGVVGLSWAFLAAGCPTTVVSQWKAHSAATATLMVEFHRQLLRGHSKPEALRQAQLTLRKNPRYRHPFYWASFMVIGKP